MEDKAGILDIREFEETFVIHFGSEYKQINAYTLASTLVSIADAAKEANLFINPGFEVEVVVEALGPGSFKAKVRTVYKSLENLFSRQNLKTIALGIIAAYIYQHTLAPDIDINVKVDDKCVIIEQSDKKIIIPKTVHEALKLVEKSDKFKQGINRTFEALEKDDKIKSIGFSKEFIDEKPPIEIPRDQFSQISSVEEDESPTRQIIEFADLRILRAILERSKRRWEFVWQGIKISAPVLCSKFYDDFFAHKITIAPGDALKVKMRIYQVRLPDIGVYTNERYEIIEVLEHIPKLRQTKISTKKF
jgi:hypothetical protein